MPKQRRKRTSQMDEVYSSQQFQHDNDLEMTPKPDYVEVDPTNLHRNQSTLSRNPIVSNVIKQLPSRDIDKILDSHQNATLNRHKNKYGGGFSTLRLHTVTPSVFNELEASQLADMIANDPDTDDMALEDVEKMNEEKLRELHYSLSAKRDIKKKLERNNRKKQKKLSCWKHLKYSWSMKWLHFKSSVKEFFLNLKLWKKPLRAIEGNFGSAVASYFRYLRWLFGLNIFFFSIIVIFIVMPQLFTKLPNADLELHSVCDNITHNISNSHNNSNIEKFTGKELITGGDSFKNSYLYYGAYSSKVLSLAGLAYYDIPMAYLLTIGIGLVLLLIVTAVILAKSYKQNYIEHSGFGGNFFSNKVFCGWDFAITSRKAATLHSSSLVLDLKEHLSSLKSKPLSQSVGDKCRVFGVVLSTSILAIGILCAVGYLMYYLLEKNSLETDIHFLREMSLSLTVSAITIVIPVMFTVISKFEILISHQRQLLISMIRSLLLIAVIMGMLLYFWLNPNHENSIKILDSDKLCWETQLGMEIYRLMIVDFFVWVLLYSVAFWIKKLICKEIKWFGNLEFDVSWHTWNLIYNQALCWIGTYFCPLICLVFIIKLLITFYIKKITVMNFCVPPSRVWRANRAETVFLGITFVALILSMVAVGYNVIQHNSSNVCGPFRMLEKPYDIITCIMSTFGKERQWLGLIAVFITKPGCVTIFIIVLCCWAYYASAVARAKYKMMLLLREQVITEGKDKVFLLQMFTNAVKHAHHPILINSNSNDTKPQVSNINGRGDFLNENEPRNYYSPYDSGNYRSENLEEFNSSNQPISHSISDIHLNQSYPEQPLRNMEDANEYHNRTNPFDAYMEEPHSSRESIGPLTRIEMSPKKGAENIAFRDDSPLKFKSDPIQSLPGVSHQHPFQNVRDKRKHK